MRRNQGSQFGQWIIAIGSSVGCAGPASGISSGIGCFGCCSGSLFGCLLLFEELDPMFGTDKIVGVELAHVDTVVKEDPIPDPVESIDHLDLAQGPRRHAGQVDCCPNNFILAELSSEVGGAREEWHRQKHRLTAEQSESTSVALGYPRTVAMNPASFDSAVRTFLSERHLATLSLVVPGHGLHVTPVGFTFEPEDQTVRVITFSASKKVRLIEQHGEVEAAVAQVDGGRWLTLHGLATVSADPDVNRDAEHRYAQRYRPPKDRGSDRRTILLRIDRALGRA